VVLETDRLQHFGHSLYQVRICKLIGENARDFPISGAADLDQGLSNLLFESEFCGPILLLVGMAHKEAVLSLLKRAGYQAFSFGRASLGAPRVTLG
jgi:hypothetical protein